MLRTSVFTHQCESNKFVKTKAQYGGNREGFRIQNVAARESLVTSSGGTLVENRGGKRILLIRNNDKVPARKTISDAVEGLCVFQIAERSLRRMRLSISLPRLFLAFSAAGFTGDSRGTKHHIHRSRLGIEINCWSAENDG